MKPMTQQERDEIIERHVDKTDPLYKVWTLGWILAVLIISMGLAYYVQHLPTLN